MQTNYNEGDRTIKERERHQNTWFCDYPHCNKVYHHTPYCPNKRKFLFKFWRFVVYFER